MPIKSTQRKPKYYLNSGGDFVIENYNFSKPFANFFPGIAGKYGIPMWVFYVNRAQGIASFGIKNKDHPILEFLPANKSWQSVSFTGFRTFIKILSGRRIFYEPFRNSENNLRLNLANRMLINSSDLTLEETNRSLGLKINVGYFTIPNDYYAALVRILTVTNLKDVPQKIQLLDGLPQIIPFGVSNLFLKKLGRTIEAWMNVENLERRVPFYKLDVDPTDRPEVIRIKEGNFYLGFHYQQKKPRIIKPIIDWQTVFGAITDFSFPYQFAVSDNFAYPRQKVTKNKTPSAMSLLNFTLPPNAEKKIYSVTGYMRDKRALNLTIPKIVRRGYLSEKKEENRKIIRDIQANIAGESNSREFDLYAKQTYLDNIIRGGYPSTFGSGSSLSVFYLYARKHGDLERDYNKFQIQPTYFSQGNGNYRDMNQNRRCDVWLNPDIKDENVITFFNLLQTDGFNPLVIKNTVFTLNIPAEKLLEGLVKQEGLPAIKEYLRKPFTPGDLIFFIKENNIRLKATYDELLNKLLPACEKTQQAEHGEGFWIDHWTYNLDLLETFLGIYPEELKELVFYKRAFTYYDNSATIRRRSEKYLLKDGLIRQLHAVCPDTIKREMIKKREQQPHCVRGGYGKGDIYKTTLINKLLCLMVNKLASLDPCGVGIEMEADKPNWFDALNGLPALFGSSLNETWELKRLILFINWAINRAKIEKIFITEEVRDFLSGLDKLIEADLRNNSPGRDFRFWQDSCSLKENYREKTRLGLSAREHKMSAYAIIEILNNALKKLDLGIEKARAGGKDIYYAYFINEVKEYKINETNSLIPLKFIQRKLPLFLESQMHALRLCPDKKKARSIYKSTKASCLYDKKLKMYKVSACLNKMPEEIGRCRVFAAGWLEHESIWLHMEYKYLLEILKQGLYEEFYDEFRNVLIPFQNPQRYGRSILENCSFLVSSAFADEKLHGNGFVARLSGSTAEFVQMWLIMNVGKQPFTLNENNELSLRFSPALARWLFRKKDNAYGFNFLGKIRVTYHNPKRRHTFGKNAATPKKIIFKDKDGSPVEIASDTIPSPYAEQIRLRQIDRLDIHLL